MGASGDYAAGSVGGEKEHTLTVDEMPKHKHKSNNYINGYAQSMIEKDKYITMLDYINGAGVESLFASVSDSGGSQPHNNMPPYIGTYRYRRIA